MRIAGMQKLTLLDYPGLTAATVFTPGCNLRCPFCHNGELVADGRAPSEKGPKPADPAAASLPFPELAVDDVLSFLRSRRGLLDGVCISGGEPLLQPGLDDFCRALRELGFAVKLDTNGTLPDRLRALLDAGLVDYVAMDAKNAPERYAETSGLEEEAAGAKAPHAEDALASGNPPERSQPDVAPASAFPLANAQESMRLLLAQDPAAGGVRYEFRTTAVRELHAPDDLRALAIWLADEARAVDASQSPVWFIQNFKDSDAVLAGAGKLHPWNEDDLRALLPELQAILPTARLRSID